MLGQDKAEKEVIDEIHLVEGPPEGFQSEQMEIQSSEPLLSKKPIADKIASEENIQPKETQILV